jgi:hypothetical protein
MRSTTHILRHDRDAWRTVPFPPGEIPSSLRITDLAAVAGQAWLIGSDSLRMVSYQIEGQFWHEHQPPAQCVPAGFSSGIARYCVFRGIVAFSPDDVWACGYGTWAGFTGPLLLHWDGVSWRTVDVGLNGSGVLFNAITGRSANDLWVIGNSIPTSGEDFTPSSVALHGTNCRDGASWHVVGELPPVQLVCVSQDGRGRPWLVHSAPEPTSTIACYEASKGRWEHMFAPGPPGTVGVDLHGLAAVPGGSTMFAVGAAVGRAGGRRALVLRGEVDSAT